MLRILIASAAALSVTAPSAADAAVAPGRVAHAVGVAAPENTPDARGADDALLLPDGGALLAGQDRYRGFRLAWLDARGALQRVVRHGLPGYTLLQVLRRPGGRLIVVGTTAPRDPRDAHQLTLVGLLPDGRLDAGFGERGVATPGIQGSCASCAPAALAPDGSLVVTGSAGPRDGRHWVVARLTQAGTLDPSFRVVPVGGIGGYTTLVDGDGRIVVIGTRGRDKPAAMRLLPDGRPDPSFNGGEPALFPLSALSAFLGPDGSITGAAHEGVSRLTPAGAPDRGFGDGGAVRIVNSGFLQITPAPDGGVIAYQPPSYEPRPADQPTILVERIDRAGRPERSQVRLGFGGGIATGAFLQNSFRVARLLQRPDGSFLAVGDTRLVQYTGEGTGFSTAFFSAASLTPSLELDAAWARPWIQPSAGVKLVAQRASTVRLRRSLLVRLRASDPGLAEIRVRDARGRVVSVETVPAWSSVARTARIRLNAYGRRALRRGMRLRVTATFRDLTGASVATQPTGERLR